MIKNSTIYIIDDDETVAHRLRLLMESVKYTVAVYSESNAFLQEYKGEPGCLICDIRLPKISGLELQKILNQSAYTIPIIFITAYNDANTAVVALKNGAFDFLVKPFNHDYLLDLVNKALNTDVKQRNLFNQAHAFEHLMENLTPREFEVMQLMAKGKTTKAIAKILGISPPTVEVHRGKIKKKLSITTIAELINKLNSVKQIHYKGYLPIHSFHI